MRRPQPSSESGEDLAYRIELWQAPRHDAVERVLARAVSAALARAIFQAAQSEHPERRITLSKGAHVIADSAGARTSRSAS
jgi:hypothetical protein